VDFKIKILFLLENVTTFLLMKLCHVDLLNSFRVLPVWTRSARHDCYINKTTQFARYTWTAHGHFFSCIFVPCSFLL